MNKRLVFKVIGYEVGGLAALAAVAALILVATSWWNWLKPMWASLIVAQYAHKQEGEIIPFEYVQYTEDMLDDPWGLFTNSEWLMDYTRKIVPFFAYEKITIKPMYPMAVMFSPYVGNRSFHVGGTNYLLDNMITINERYLLDKRWNDQRETLSVLVHELVHTQSGNFGPWGGMEVDDFEANTQAATIEVLAAMCNYGDELACKAFWMEVEAMARTRLMIQMKERNFADGAYQWLADQLWRDNLEERAARKALRFWADDPDERWYILRAYSAKPYVLFARGLKGLKLDTGITYNEDGKRFILGMPWDDTLDILPGWIELLVSLSA